MAVSYEIWVHDTRVSGFIADTPGRKVIRVNQTTPVMSIANSVKAAVHGAGGASVLWLVFHGSYTGTCLSESEGGWEDALFGGMTEFGQDGVKSTNVAMFGQMIRGLFSDSIRVLSCGGAARWNGMEVCRRLAYHSNTLVIASQDTQEYSITQGGAIDVGQWEGRVIKFLPTGEAMPWFVGPTATGSESPNRSVDPRYPGR